MGRIRARVFLSCGQRKNSHEPGVVESVREVLEPDYHVYVAADIHSTKSLRENIFRRLENSEYFLFIDLRREQLVLAGQQTGSEDQFRGSLFCAQELSIAAYLGLDVLAFHQKGVNDLDGMNGTLQLNSVPFAEPGELPNLVGRAVKEHWHSGWQNALILEDTTTTRVDSGSVLHLGGNPVTA